MYIITWQNEDRRFLFKKNGQRFIDALLDRGHKLKLQWTDICGTTYVVFE